MKKKLSIIILLVSLLLPTLTTQAATNLAQRLKGRLLLQVEKGGMIWYVDTNDLKRYNVTWDNALHLFEQLSLGISNADLDKIPVAGNSDTGNLLFRDRLKGKLLLQVEQGGAIWYMDMNGFRHQVTWDNLMPLFEGLALGVTDVDLCSIVEGEVGIVKGISDNKNEQADVSQTQQYQNQSEPQLVEKDNDLSDDTLAKEIVEIEVKEDSEIVDNIENIELQNKVDALEKELEEMLKLVGNYNIQPEYESTVDYNSLFNLTDQTENYELVEEEYKSNETNKAKEAELQSKINILKVELEKMTAELELLEAEYNKQRDYVYFLQSQPAQTETTITEKNSGGYESKTTVTTTQNPDLEQIQEEKRKMLKMAQELGSLERAIEIKLEELQNTEKLLCVEQGNTWCD